MSDSSTMFRRRSDKRDGEADVESPWRGLRIILYQTVSDRKDIFSMDAALSSVLGAIPVMTESSSERSQWLL